MSQSTSMLTPNNQQPNVFHNYFSSPSSSSLTLQSSSSSLTPPSSSPSSLSYRPRPFLHICSVTSIVIFVLLSISLTHVSLCDAKMISTSLEVSQPRALSSGTTKGFHRKIVMHDPYITHSQSTPSTLIQRAFRILRKRLLLSSTSEKFHTVELFGGMVAVGEYYAKIKIGGQTLRVQIDTGSATLAAPLKQCVNCKRGDMRYSVEDSNSGIAKYVSCSDEACMQATCGYGCGKCSSTQACCAKANDSNCAFHLNFGDGSGAKGMLVHDEFEWGDAKFPVTFGGIASDSPDFERKQVDGILGMAYKSLACNPSCVNPTFDAMYEQEKSNGMKNQFSICITYDAGRLVLGDHDSSLSTKEPAWVPLHLSDPASFYSFPVVGDLLVDDKPLPLPRYSRAIVDSGTTLIVFSTATFNKFKQHLLTHYCQIPGLCPGHKWTGEEQESWFQAAHCAKLYEKDRKLLPTLTFRLEGFDLKMGPDDYMINYASKGPEFWCVGIMSLDSMSGGVDVILGNTVMKRYVTIYDRENKKVGFADSDTNCGISSSSSSSNTVTNGNSGSGGNGTSANGNSDSSKDDKACSVASDCKSCFKVENVSCKWDAGNNKCVGGSALPWMCKLEELESNFGVWIGGAVAAVIAAIVVVAVVVQIARKRRDAALEDDSEAEVEQPLAPNDGDSSTVDTRTAFAIGEDEDGDDKI